MNRNTQAHFAQIPSMDISRSKFDRSFNHTTTGNLGELIPVFVDPDIVPGDSVFMKMSDLIRMTTPVCPTMGDLKADFYWFFVPNRLVWTNFKKFWGENDTAPWIQQNEYQIPQIEISNKATSNNKLTYTVVKGSVLDHMGIPTQYGWKYKGQGTPAEPERTISISQLPTRAYCMIWNEFFRSESLQNPVNVFKGDTKYNIINEFHNDYITNAEAAQVTHAFKGGLPCLKTCKTFDYFTAGLPQPQAGPDVTLPMNGNAPIKTKEFKDTYNENEYTYGHNSDELYYNSEYISDNVVTSGTGADDWSFSDLTSGKLIADLSQATGATINQLRTAFAIQKWQEREARGGQRYIESVLAHYKVSNPDYRLQRPEYLGGYTHAIQVNQVLSQGNDTTGAPIGTTGAYSLSINSNGDVFSHSFTEHGILMCLMTIRQSQHVYQQGVNRAWFKKNRVDFYTPEFANLGETFITEDEIYATGIAADDKAAFAYQERWAEMRYLPDMVSGSMRSDYPQSLDVWHYADDYNSAPNLGSTWIQETDANLKRTLALQNEDEFKIDLYFGATYTRPLPMWSVPGLLDHH